MDDFTRVKKPSLGMRNLNDTVDQVSSGTAVWRVSTNADGMDTAKAVLYVDGKAASATWGRSSNGRWVRWEVKCPATPDGESVDSVAEMIEWVYATQRAAV